MAKAKEAKLIRKNAFGQEYFGRQKRVPLQVAVKSRNSAVIRMVLKHSQRINYGAGVSWPKILNVSHFQLRMKTG